MGGITDALGLSNSKSGKKSAQASIEASELQAEYQREALDYLKQQNQLPTEYRDKGLEAYGNIFLNGGLQSPTEQEIMNNPLYKAILGTQGAAEESVLRNQAATGGFRSGGTQANLANTAADIQRNALLSGYQDELGRKQYNIGGLQSLAQLPNNAGQIAGLTAGIGQTLAQGQIAAAQARQAGGQQNVQNNLGLANLGLQAFSAFSDDDLKQNITATGKTSHPDINTYQWEWNSNAAELGLFGGDAGYLASEIENVWPELVGLDESGYRKINKSEIDKRLGELNHG